MAETFRKWLRNAVFKRPASNEFTVWSGSNASAIPSYPIKTLNPDVIGACTGPLSGLCCIQLDNANSQEPIPAAGIIDWNCPIAEADGASLSLYDRKAGTDGHHGDPNADVYAVIARPDSGIVAVADGCNWGLKPRQAARCAANGSIQHLNETLYSSNAPRDTKGVVQVIRDSFDSAQRSIITNGGTTTTLCVAVVCELDKPKGDFGWGLCVVSVGDSPCFVWQSKTGRVIEVTSASHEGHSRNMRDSGGCLGANIGDEPDLENLVCCLALLAEGDIVFVTSDGVSDNFDPVTLHEGVEQSTSAIHGESSLPVLSPDQRQATLLANLTRVIEGVRCQSKDESVHACKVKEAIMKHVTEVTDPMRTYIESYNFDNPALTSVEKESEVTEKLKTLGGKLDHATLAVYEVCCHHVDR